MFVKREESEFKPISVVLETQRELDMFIELIEAGYQEFERFSDVRDLGITISDTICCYSTDSEDSDGYYGLGA